MLVKWHTKPYAAKRPAKHPHCFHNYKDYYPPLNVVRPLLAYRIYFYGLIHRLRLISPYLTIP